MSKKTFGLYLDVDNVATAQKGVVKRDFDGNLSAFMDSLLERAIAEAPTVVEGKDDILLELARVFHPTLRRELAEVLGAAPQPRIVARILEALLEALKRDDFDPTAPFHVYNSLDQLTAQVTKTAPGITLMKSLAEYIQRESEATPLAAEDAPDQGGASSAAGAVEKVIAAEDKRRAAARAEGAAGDPAGGRKPGETERSPRKTKG